MQFSACRDSNLTDSDRDESSQMVTRFREGIPSCTPATSSFKQKKAHSTSQPEFPSEDTTATNEANQNFLAFHHLASNSNSANFNNNVNRISKPSEPFTTSMPLFDGKSEKFELFEDLFRTSLKIHNQLTEEDRIHYFTLSCVLMLYRRSKLSTAPAEKVWQNSWLSSVEKW